MTAIMFDVPQAKFGFRRAVVVLLVVAMAVMFVVSLVMFARATKIHVIHPTPVTVGVTDTTQGSS